MKIEEPKKPNREAGKWEEHMNKKKGPSAGSESEITPAKKKPAAEPVAAKTEAKAAPAQTQSAKAGQAHSHEGHDHSHEGHDHAGHTHEAKPQAKAADKTVKAADVKAHTAAGKGVKKKAEKKSRKVHMKKSEDVSLLRGMVLTKAGTPVFRGRFGKRNIRRKSIAKWNVWRVPRGIDVKKSMADGYMPHIGFATPRKIRNVHPSGYREFRVKTLQELSTVPKGHAVRVISGLGRKKKIELVDKAIEMGVKVLNP